MHAFTRTHARGLRIRADRTMFGRHCDDATRRRGRTDRARTATTLTQQQVKKGKDARSEDKATYRHHAVQARAAPNRTGKSARR
ncbi:hypothetical protein BN2476_910003 [Paraburkholderia piptadeniae]|uniref:Uncharacterized protein n=1 Tax=Paraburkholderia piptadeniae TaxID=1701573 RepID=A0A1N7ST56_9BURK|nr:hypothetical protein BN2476_910003 [Paraburkholderia piptadeniae]